MPVLAGVWAWNRLRDHAAATAPLKSGLAALLVFEMCTLLRASAGLERWQWTGGWGLAASLALQTSLGDVGSWVVAGALLLASALAASEMGFHWIGALMHGAVVKPAQGAAAAYGSWQENRAEAQRVAAKQRARDEKDARRKPARAAAARRCGRGRRAAGTAAAAAHQRPRGRGRGACEGAGPGEWRGGDRRAA